MEIIVNYFKWKKISSKLMQLFFVKKYIYIKKIFISILFYNLQEQIKLATPYTLKFSRQCA